jgi:benzoate-CoA ligase
MITDVRLNLANYIINKSKIYQQDKVAIRDDVGTLTYNQISPLVKKFAHYLREQNITPGDRVAMVMGDRIEWCIAFLGVIYIGANPVLVSPRIPKENLKSMIKNCNANAIIYSKDEIDVANLSTPKTTVLVESIEILRDGPALEEYYEYHPDELSYWCSSSGTSGRGQRYILHRHQTFFKAIELNTIMHDITSETIMFITPKLTFSYGMINMLYGLSQGSTIIVSGKVPGRKHVCEVVRTYKATHLVSTSSVLAAMTKISQPSIDLDSIGWIISGGEVLPKYIETKFKELYSKDIFNGIGMAEVGGSWVTSQRPDMKRAGSIGVPLEGVVCEVRDANGNICKPFEQGELFVSHPCLAIMYWNSYDLSRETFVNKWFKTRDIVYIDHDGFLYYVCRADDLIKINGGFVSPIEIEEELAQHTAIDDSVVTHYLNKQGFPIIVASIVLKDNNKMSEGDVRNFLSQRLEKHKIPRKINFVTELLKTVTTKKIRMRAT